MTDDKVLSFLASDPVAFISYYSGMKLADFQCELLYAIDRNEHNRIAVLLPAGHGKSTLISMWYVIFKVCQNPNVRIIVVMRNQSESQRYALAIRKEFTSNHRLIADFGTFYPKGRDAVWSNEAINVAKRQINVPQPTIMFAGAATISDVLGKRCDIIICDDIVTPETVSTQAQRDKQWAQFNTGVETCPQYIWPVEDGKLQVPEGIFWPEGVEYRKLILVGTVFHPDDLFHRKVGRIGELPHGELYTHCTDPRYVAIKYDCWKDPAKRIPLWPDKFTAADLEGLERADPVAFNQRYRNIAVDDAVAVFKRAWIFGSEEGEVTYPGCVDFSRSYGEIPPDVNLLVLGVDPSTGRRNSDSTYSAFVLLGVNTGEEEPVRYIIDYRRERLSFDQIIDAILDGNPAEGVEGFRAKYDYDYCVIEDNAAQQYLLDNNRIKAARLSGTNIIGHSTQSRNKRDPIAGVTSMQELFKRGLVSLPWANDPVTRERTLEFIDQLLAFPTGFYDAVMALWIAETAVRMRKSPYRAIGPSRGQQIRVPR